jgi:hypothetical protein
VVRRPELELRRAALRRPVGQWDQLTVGVILDAYDHDATVEFRDEAGVFHTLTLSYEDLALLEEVQQERLPVDA